MNTITPTRIWAFGLFIAALLFVALVMLTPPMTLSDYVTLEQIRWSPR